MCCPGWFAHPSSTSVTRDRRVPGSSQRTSEPARTAVAAFLGERLARGAVALPPYEALVAGIFLPHAPTLGWLIMAGQPLAGLALLTGALTRAALLGGLFMNFNFLLAGEPNPSAF